MKHQQQRRQHHPATAKHLTVVTDEEPTEETWARAWRAEHDTDVDERAAA